MPEKPIMKVELAAPTVVPVEIVANSSNEPSASEGSAGTVHPGQTGSASQNKPDVMVLPGGKAIAMPTTTEEEDRTSAGQRMTSNMWESTQRLIALSVVWVALMVAGSMAVFAKTESVQTASLVFLFGVANLVIGFYFGRTNHQRVGGVGPMIGR